MKKMLYLVIGMLLVLGVLLFYKAPQCLYEIGNGYFAGNALIPTIIALISFLFFAQARFGAPAKNAFCSFLLGSGFLVLMIPLLNNTDPIPLFNPDDMQYACAIQESTFPSYYLKDKLLYVNTDFSTAMPTSINKIKTDFTVPTEKYTPYLQSLEKWIQKGWEGNVTYWIVTEEWESDKDIYCFDIGQNRYICPSSVYERCIDPYSGLELDSYEMPELEDENNPFPNTILRKYNNINNLLLRECFVILVYFIFGWLLTICVIPKGRTLLATLLSLPVGCGLFALVGYVTLILHLSYNWATFVVIASVILLFILLNDRRSISRLKEADYLVFIAGLITVTFLSAFIIYRALYLPGGDTYACALNGMSIAGNPQFFFSSIDWIASFGLFYSILNSQSYLLGGDFLFAINVLMGIIAVILLIYFSYGLVRIKLKKDSVLGEGLIALVALILFLSADFHIHIFYFLANMPVAVWFLVSFGLIVLGRENGDFAEYWKIVLICFVMIIQSRIEGGLYVAFFLTCLLMNYIEDRYYLSLALTCWVWSLQLNIIQMIYNGGVEDTFFWNPKRGMLLLMSLAMPLVLFVLKKSSLPVLRFVFERYYDFLLICLLIGTVVISCAKREMASHNIVVFIIHIIENKYYWMTIFALAPIIMISTCKRGFSGSFSMTVILGYMCMLFVLFLFRNEGENGMTDPLSVGMWDSGRRTLFQIMPTAAFLALYEIISWLREREQYVND